MNKLAYSLSLLLLLLISNLDKCVNGEDEQDKVNINVYYESLCPDSQKFINYRLKEALLTFKNDVMNIKLIPFGNANVK
jgi:interferon, gamma-inducible protein 30